MLKMGKVIISMTPKSFYRKNTIFGFFSKAKDHNMTNFTLIYNPYSDDLESRLRKSALVSTNIEVQLSYWALWKA